MGNTILKHVNTHKAPVHDQITCLILRNLTQKGFQFITQLFNAILRLRQFFKSWKTAVIILIPKHGKPDNQPASYRPISLLPTPSKVLNSMLFQKIYSIFTDKHLIPDHQFGFRRHHATIEQAHRVVDFDERRHCAAVFLYVKQAFDKVWFDELLCKIKTSLPTDYFELLKSYLSNRHFLVRYGNALTPTNPINPVFHKGGYWDQSYISY